MKNILYRMLPICLFTIGLTGCEDETKYRPLPEAVPLTMSINEKAFVMGENLKVNINVDADADGNEMVANEDFDIYFTAKAGTEDVSGVFEPFSGIVTFPKGEKQIQVDFPVKKSGLTGSTAMEFVAFARGYKMANSSQAIKVSDYYRITMSLENNVDNVVTEGDKFVLVAKIDKAKAIPIDVTITPKEGEEGRYENLPSSITIPAGRTSVKSAAITIKADGEKTGDLNLTLNFESSSSVNPMISPTLSIVMTDLESLADPDLYDMTKVYLLPESPFASSQNRDLVHSWFTGRVTDIEENSVHSNEVLAAEGWRFHYAVEFHKIEPANYWDATSNMLKCFASSNEAAVQKVATVNNKECSNLNNNGELVMWADAVHGGSKAYGFSAMQCCKVNGGQGSPFLGNFTRIYPGMRIEFKVRLRGVRTGFVPTIEIKNPDVMSNGAIKAIKILQNKAGSFITQSVTGDKVADAVSKVTAIPQANEYNIYWVELVDDEHIQLGINGVATMTVSKNDLGSWPFEKAAMPSNKLGCRGLFLVMRMSPSDDLEAGNMEPGWDSDLKSVSDPETEGPRMEIDWIRFYVNDAYKVESNETNNRNTIFY
ncbi:DUF5006 domain-containing protein [Bacteroides finegoldii]|uniref:DUF5006 domain-containing protein n=1 Tax=Bacteroides finegoldii TaxID=338188 RepID=UPI00189E2016|nr:DUF5006 domain-containing protein [Bacteroides finegoldii]